MSSSSTKSSSVSNGNSSSSSLRQRGKQGPVLVAGSDSDDYLQVGSNSPQSKTDCETPVHHANSKDSAANAGADMIDSPSGPTFQQRLASFRDLFFKAFRVDTRYGVLGEETWEYTEEPHVTRRQLILAKHPEVKKLMGYDPFICWYVGSEVAIQIFIVWLISRFNPSWWLIVPAAWTIGGFLNHSLGSSIHEIGHNLAFGHKRAWANRVLGLIANLPYGVPTSVSYRKYHQEHHRWLGHDVLDVDIPTRIEVALFRTPITKIIWLLCHPVIHAVRPFFKSPKPIWGWEVVNFIVQMSFNAFIFYTFGWKSLAYLLLSTVLGHGIHPLSGHFISEHYLFQSNDHQATHSYYGPLNWIMFNLGYHIEHHDFPYIPYRRLPELRRIAHEFYDPLPYHTSWCKVVWDFIFQDTLGPHSHSVASECTTKPEIYIELPSTQQYFKLKEGHANGHSNGEAKKAH